MQRWNVSGKRCGSLRQKENHPALLICPLCPTSSKTWTRGKKMDERADGTGVSCPRSVTWPRRRCSCGRLYCSCPFSASSVPQRTASPTGPALTGQQPLSGRILVHKHHMACRTACRFPPCCTSPAAVQYRRWAPPPTAWPLLHCKLAQACGEAGRKPKGEPWAAMEKLMFGSTTCRSCLLGAEASTVPWRDRPAVVDGTMQASLASSLFSPP